MNRFTKRSPSPHGRLVHLKAYRAKVASPYRAWFSMPVPTQHQKESSGVEYVLKCPG
jgi:hypothetical protein